MNNNFKYNSSSSAFISQSIQYNNLNNKNQYNSYPNTNQQYNYLNNSKTKFSNGNNVIINSNNNINSSFNSNKNQRTVSNYSTNAKPLTDLNYNSNVSTNRNSNRNFNVRSNFNSNHNPNARPNFNPNHNPNVNPNFRQNQNSNSRFNPNTNNNLNERPNSYLNVNSDAMHNPNLSYADNNSSNSNANFNSRINLNAKKNNSAEQIAQKPRIDYYNIDKSNINKKIRSKEKRKLKIIIFPICAAISLFLIFLFLNNSIFVVKKINIMGLKSKTDKDILAITGIKMEQSISSIDTEKVKQKLEKSGILILKEFKFDYPNGITISLYEKEPVASLSSNGIIYFLDKDGTVISQRYGGSVDNSFIEIKNCLMRETASGANVIIKLEWQKLAFSSILNTLYKWNAADLFKSINLVDESNIYLTSQSNNIVCIGDAKQIDEKIVAAITVLSYLKQNNTANGRIDVTIPNNPIFSLEDTKG